MTLCSVDRSLSSLGGGWCLLERLRRGRCVAPGWQEKYTCSRSPLEWREQSAFECTKPDTRPSGSRREAAWKRHCRQGGAQQKCKRAWLQKVLKSQEKSADASLAKRQNAAGHSPQDIRAKKKRGARNQRLKERHFEKCSKEARTEKTNEDKNDAARARNERFKERHAEKCSKEARIEKTNEDKNDAARARNERFKERHPEKCSKEARMEKTHEEKKEASRERNERFKERHPEKCSKEARTEKTHEKKKKRRLAIEISVSRSVTPRSSRRSDCWSKQPESAQHDQCQ